MAESTALEMRHTRKGIVGSNPTLSATLIEIINFYSTSNTSQPTAQWCSIMRASWALKVSYRSVRTRHIALRPPTLKTLSFQEYFGGHPVGDRHAPARRAA